MVGERLDLRTLEFREIFPFLHLFRGLRIAADPRKLALGAVGAVVMSLGWLAIARVMIGAEPIAPAPLSTNATEKERLEYAEDLSRFNQALRRHQALSQASKLPWMEGSVTPSECYRSPLTAAGWSNGVPHAAKLALEPLRALTFPVRIALFDASAALAGVMLAIWTLLVWGLFGGAITRIAAVQVAQENQLRLGESLRYVMGRYFSYVLAPLWPFVGVALLLVACAAGGALTWVPIVDVLMGFVWFLALVAGAALAVALFGLALGWPLMFASLGAEGLESTDALSRAYNFVLGRPWHYLFYGAVAAVYGAVLTTFVVGFAFETAALSQYAVSWGVIQPLRAQAFYAFAPEAGGWREALGPAGEYETGGTMYVASLLVGFWTHVLFLGVVGFAYSYFWSATTIMYFLLRREVDGTEMDEVFLEASEEEPFPTVSGGAPAAPPTPPAVMAGGRSLPIVDPPFQANPPPKPNVPPPDGARPNGEGPDVAPSI